MEEYYDKFILSLDQGTTNSKAVLFSQTGRIVKIAQRTMKQIYPATGWVEQDPEEIFQSQLIAAREVLVKSKITPSNIAALGLANQRETTILWDKRTLKPVSNAIVWQDKRNMGFCDYLKKAGHSKIIRAKTGLVIDPYFSATKIQWILDKYPSLRERARRGEIIFGTVDSFLLYRLTQGSLHATDYSNASRTMLFDISKLSWDDELLKLFRIPREILPEVRPSSEIFAETHEKFFGRRIPIAAIAGDQQASLFGQAALRRGMMKNTYGTGCFLLANAGNSPSKPVKGLLTTIAWGLAKNRITYALEGSILSAGSAMEWIRNLLGMGVDAFSKALQAAGRLQGNDGLYFVPALSGLGSPVWDDEARGLIIGITGATTRKCILRSVLEGICYQTGDVVEAIEKTTGRKTSLMRVDGGAARNDFLMQFQSDILGITLQRPYTTEATSLGAAYLAGLSIGLWKNLDEIEKLWKLDREFTPRMNDSKRNALYQKWKNAVNRSLAWAS